DNSTRLPQSRVAAAVALEGSDPLRLTFPGAPGCSRDSKAAADDCSLRGRRSGKTHRWYPCRRGRQWPAAGPGDTAPAAPTHLPAQATQTFLNGVCSWLSSRFLFWFRAGLEKFRLVRALRCLTIRLLARRVKQKTSDCQTSLEMSPFLPH